LTTTQSTDAAYIAKALAAVADPYRLSILNELLEKGSIRCCDAVALTGLSQPTCSHHIRLLTESELVESRKEGRNIYFTLNKENFQKLSRYFGQFTK
jgi:ArsR family transcriptional regulator, arsenate/arsenite/antimonite-responsive transcriptional repressor